MRITHEADYAIRIVFNLSKNDGVTAAKEIAEQCGITLKFALKILRKLTLAGIIRSHKGVRGGYELNRSPCELSFGSIIEAIDGPIEINHCLGHEFECTRVHNKQICDIRSRFLDVNNLLKRELYSMRIDELN